MLIKFHNINTHGYSLIELILTIVLTAIVMTIFYNLFAFNQARSVSPVMQMRASELGQAYLEEIGLKRFDENSPIGNQLRCDQLGTQACNGIQNEEGISNRRLFDDVDDYNGLAERPPIDALGNTRLGYNNFTVEVSVVYAGDDFGFVNNSLKKIEVRVTSPEGDSFVFSQYKGNF